MKYYFAPMEGLTDSVYRRLHHQFFGGVDRYYMPFLSPTVHRELTHKEQRELPVAEAEDFLSIPQLLTKNPEDFLWAAQVCRDRGYREVNLNLGCPSGTVVAKGKGAGMLRDLEALNSFLSEIYEKAPLPISVKTRLGLENPEEFPALLEIFNRYPIHELTVHPRVRKQLYDGSVDMTQFRYGVENSKNPLCYNGDLTSVAEISAFRQEFPGMEAVMLGRGLIADPGMLRGGTDPATLRRFMDTLLEQYIVEFSGSRNAMFRLKEHWSFLFSRLEVNDKLKKRLRKTTELSDYRAITAEIFHSLT